MPNRLLRDGICTSELINSLSSDEEILFYRLLVVCDDFGHMDGRLTILKAQCFPLRETATLKSVSHWLDGLAAKGLVRRYAVGDKPFIAIGKWENRVRSRPKYPLPDVDGARWIDDEPRESADDSLIDAERMSADCQQDADNCPTPVGVGRGRGRGKGEGATSRTRRELRTLPAEWQPSESTTENLAKEYSLTPEDVARYVGAFRDSCAAKGYRYSDFDAAFRNCVRDDWPKFRQRAGTLQRSNGRIPI